MCKGESLEAAPAHGEFKLISTVQHYHWFVTKSYSAIFKTIATKSYWRTMVFKAKKKNPKQYNMVTTKLEWPWDRSPRSPGLGKQTQRRAGPGWLWLSRERIASMQQKLKLFLCRHCSCYGVRNNQLMTYLYAGFIYKSPRLSSKRAKRMDKIRGRSAASPVFPFAFATLREAVVLATGSRDQAFHTCSTTGFTVICDQKWQASHLLPGVLGTFSKCASAPWGGWAGTSTTPPSFPAYNIWGTTTMPA